MYVKPEVTRYTGTELLDLMGPAETAYECDLSGQQGTQDDICDLEFLLVTPDGRSLEDSFPGGLSTVGIGFELTGPNNCGTWSGVCGANENDCVFNLGEPDAGDTYVWMVYPDACHSDPSCDPDGDWELTAWWIDDGDELPSCTVVDVNFEDQ
jgi:hypothetical protein